MPPAGLPVAGPVGVVSPLAGGEPPITGGDEGVEPPPPGVAGPPGEPTPGEDGPGGEVGVCPEPPFVGNNGSGSNPAAA